MHYPPGTVRELLQTDLVTEPTRRVLTERLSTPTRQPTFFTTAEFALLVSICDRLIPQNESLQRIDIAGGIDKRITEQKSDGWRYDVMPPDGDAYKSGLKGMEESAQLLFEHSFVELSYEQQDEILQAVQISKVPGKTWQVIPAGRFFEELLAESVENYYSHPLAQEEIGYVGMADVPGWQHIGLNQLENREPKRQRA